MTLLANKRLLYYRIFSRGLRYYDPLQSLLSHLYDSITVGKIKRCNSLTNKREEKGLALIVQH